VIEDRLLIELALFTLAGFVAQMIDGMLSMGYGVSATSLLLAFGVSPAGASASVHTAEVFATASSAWSHWKVGNVLPQFVKKLLLPGVVGGVTGAYILTTVPIWLIKPAMAGYLVLMGVVILYKAFRTIPPPTTEPRLAALGFVGGFCDALGGGGWGPIVAGTLLARGNTPRTTIGSVAFAEFFVTFATSATLLLTIGVSGWVPIAGLALGGVVAAPLAARLTGRLRARPLMIIVAIFIIVTSTRTLLKSL
jgi:uncharacterized protein